jgi:metal-sulfur cluster biosynthetic enzyme
MRENFMGEFSQPDVEKALSGIMHPEINYSLVDLGMIKNVVCEANKVGLTLKLPFLHVPIKDLLIANIKKALTELDNTIQAEINIEEMSQEERENFTKMAKKGWKL